MTPICRMALGAAALAIGALAWLARPGAPSAPPPVVWAWERPEDLRFAGPDVVVAVLAGTLTLSGDAAAARPRLQPSLVRDGQPVAGVAHVEIDRRRPLAWNAAQRARAATALLALLADPRFTEVQVDFEVRASERQVLLDLLGDVRAGLAAGRRLSMTALASWCDTESWIDRAPVDEVVPMLFRMGPGGDALKRRIAAGGDFRHPRCRAALGVAADTPPDKVPAGRRIWMFSPRPWTAADFDTLRNRLGT